MNTRRRRGNNFTESLHSFCQADETDLNCAVLESVSQDNVGVYRSYKKEDYIIGNGNSMDSTVLAGNSAEKLGGRFAKRHLACEIQNSSVTDTYRCTLTENNSMIGETGYLFEKPDLNKCIISSDSLDTNDIDKNLSHSEFSTLRDDVENIYLCDISSNATTERSIPMQCIKSNILSPSVDCRRDTNYNVRTATNKSHSETSISDKMCTSSSDDGCRNSNVLFDTLSSLQNEAGIQNSPQKLLRRLSEVYANAPNNFTERLLTIIEESVANNESDTNRNSAVSLRRLTKEFRRMCKFLNDDYIEDESTIEFAPSLMSPATGLTPKGCGNQQVNKGTPVKETSAMNFHTDNIITTPTRNRHVKKIYRKTPKGVLKKHLSNDDISLSEVEDTFALLEDKCNRLYSTDVQATPHRSLSERNLSKDMENIRKLSELQMASLEASVNDDSNQSLCRSVSTPNLIALDDAVMKNLCQPFEKQMIQLKDKGNYKITPTSTKAFCKTADTSYLSLTSLEAKLKRQVASSPSQVTSHKNKKPTMTYFKRQQPIKESHTMNSNTPEKRLTSPNTYYSPGQVDELEKTLLLEIAEKRQRCLDTAKAIMEIDSDPQITELKNSLGRYPDLVPPDNVDSLDDNSIKFLTTLITCDAYHNYLLEKSKPLYTLQEKVKQTFAQSSTKSPKQKSSKTLSQQLPPVCVNDKTTPGSTKPQKRFFVTPGKSPTAKVERPKPQKYFSNLDTPVVKKSPRNIMKSPHASGLYRINYNTVMSPVGIYIRGTDMNLIQTVRSKTNEMLLTPKNTGQNIKNVVSNKNSLKFTLTPKEMNSPLSENTDKGTVTFSTNGDENNPDNFVLPKVVYKSPLKVQMVKDIGHDIGKKRLQTLLQDTQHKVVIRHEGKNKPAPSNDEVVYDTFNESVHVYQAAKKTNFMARKNL